MLRIVRTAALCIAAAATAIASAFVHIATARVVGVNVPYGLALALGGLGALLALAHAWANSRVDKAFVALAWLAPVLVLSQVRGAGDLVIAADVPGLMLLYGGVVLVGIVVGLPVLRSSEDGGADRGVR